MRYKIILSLLIYILWSVTNSNAAPIIYFTDVTSGSKSGGHWGGSQEDYGSAVTVWGLGFGASRGSDYITVGGVNLTSDANYAEWATTGTANGVARGLQRTTFWLNSSMSTGVTTISVTISGSTSNTLPFTIRSGNIFFIDITNGSDSYNGQYSTVQGGSNGPWQNIAKANPGSNASLNPGDTIYIRAGTYTVVTSGSSVYISENGTSAAIPYAIVGYPGDAFPVLYPGSNVENIGFLGPQGYYSFWTISKLKCKSKFAKIIGEQIRFVGNWQEDVSFTAWTGSIVMRCEESMCPLNVYVLGNLFDNVGRDSYTHVIYMKTHEDVSGEVSYIYIGYNELKDCPCGLGAEFPHGGAIETQSESGAYPRICNNLHIYNNYIHGGDCEAFTYSRVRDCYAYNNIIANQLTEGQGLGLKAKGGSIYLYNNTFYFPAHVDHYVIKYEGELGETLYSKNNIYYSRSGQTLLYMPAEGIFHSRNDVFYNGAGVPSGAKTDVADYLTSNPAFNSIPTEDFSITSGSPAKDAGLTISLVNIDYLGYGRPYNLVYDIGAYEYGASPGTTTTTTATATGISITGVSIQ